METSQSCEKEACNEIPAETGVTTIKAAGNLVDPSLQQIVSTVPNFNTSPVIFKLTLFDNWLESPCPNPKHGAVLKIK